MSNKILTLFDATAAQLIAHPDKVEMILIKSDVNVKTLRDQFPELKRKWQEDHTLIWTSGLDTYRGEWLINAENKDFQITFSGDIRNVVHHSVWPNNPFLGEMPYQGLGKMRITDKMKVNPTAYMAKVSDILRDIEMFGVQEKPRILECAIDIYGNAIPFRNSVRLAKDDPLDFWHYRVSDKEYYPGGSPSGLDTEYSMHHTFQPRRKDQFRKQNRYHRELVCYCKFEHNIYRIELRLGYRYLDSFRASKAYHTAIDVGTAALLVRDYQPLTVSPTLDLLGFLPYFASRQLKWELIALEKLYKDRRNTRCWHLKDKSLRHLRFVLFNKGLSVKEVSGYTLPIQPPRIRYVLPTRLATSSEG